MSLYVGSSCKKLCHDTEISLPTRYSNQLHLARVYKKYIRPVVGKDFQEIYLIGSAIRHPGFETRKKYYWFGRELKKIKYHHPNDIDILIITKSFVEEQKVEVDKNERMLYWQDSYGAIAYEAANFHFIFTPMVGSYREWNTLMNSAQREGFPLIHHGSPMFHNNNVSETWNNNSLRLSFIDGSIWDWQ